MVVGLTLSLVEQVSNSEFPSSLSEKQLALATCIYSSGNMLHQRHDCCSVAVFAPHGQPSLDPLCSRGLTLSLAVKVSSCEFPSSLSQR